MSTGSKLKLTGGVVILASFCLLLTLRHSSKPVAELQIQNVSEVKTDTLVETTNPLRARRISNNPSGSFDTPTKTTKILFRVLDSETGAGLPNTSIQYVFFGTGEQGEGHDTVTDANGYAPLFEPDDAAMKFGPNVFVTAEGHVPKSVNFHQLSTNEYTIKLDPALTAEGTVVDEQGQPVPDVEIFITTPGTIPGQAENIDFQTCPVTNHADGTWTCSYIPRDYTNVLHFILKNPGYATTYAQIPLRDVSMNNLVLVIDAGTTVTGKVTDLQGHPLGNARLKVLSGDRNKRKSVRTDEFGAFTLPGISPETDSEQEPLLQTNSVGNIVIRGMKGTGIGHANIAVQADGFASQTKTLTLTDITNTVDFALSPGNIFRGHIVDEEGHPVSNAFVQTDDCFDLQPHSYQKKFDWSTHTGANGAFEWDSASAEDTCYWFEAEGYEIVRSQHLRADGSDHEIRFRHRQN